MKTVLITAANTGKAYLLAHLLHDYKIIFGDDQYQDFKIPNANKSSFAHELLTLCLDNHIEVVFPLRYEELEPLTESKILFQEYGISVLIPDKFSNLNKWDKLYPDLAVKNKRTTNYSELSKALLSLGYPNSQLYIGRADSIGDLIKIDDQLNSFNHIWNGLNSLSFTQIGKVFNQQEFKPLNVYKIDEHLTKFDVLYFSGILKSVQKLEEELRMLMIRIFNELNLEGFFEIILSSNKIVRIKSNTIK